MNALLLGLLVFVGVSALVGGGTMLLRDKPNNKIEDRLNLLTGLGGASKEAQGKEASILTQPLNDKVGILQRLADRFSNITIIFEQADTNLTVPKFAAISAVFGFLGIGAALLSGIHPAAMPLAAMILSGMPMLWILFRRKKRLKAFAAQLPDALEMLGRSLRSGQSLGFGFSMVANEMPAPINKEFARVFEEQNLGIPLDDSLRNLTARIPNLDLKFFATAVILQRQTGGDLAEILDKIGELIRERFRIWGQIQALTGEGRLSGVVLLALPVVLFVAVYRLNPNYIKVLFTDPMGTKMLLIAVIMQMFGALVIRQIVNIKV
jgi:tight adherence protein B